MKKLSDLSIFVEDLPFLQERGSQRIYFRKNNRLSVIHSFLSKNGENREPVFCYGICEAEMADGSHFRSENFNGLSVEFVEKGSLYVRNASEGWLLEEGEVFLQQNGGICEFMTGPGGYCHKFSFQIIGPACADFVRYYDLTDKTVLPVRPDALRSCMRDYLRCGRLSGLDNFMENTRLTLRLFQLLRYGDGGSRIPEPLVALMRELEDHPEKNYSLPEMAEFCHCSATHLNRLFQTYWKMPPHRKVMEIRLNVAAELLLRSEFSVKEIADRAGYSNALNFSTEFRKKFGKSPSEFRKETELPLFPSP